MQDENCIKNAGMAELADAQDLGSCVHSCRFKSCYPHQIKGGTQQRAAFCLVLIMEVHGSSRAACLQDARNAAQIQPLALHCMIRGVCGAFQVLLPTPNKHRNYDTKPYRKSGACFLSGSLDL